MQLVEYLLKWDKIGYGLNFKDLRQLFYRFEFVNEVHLSKSVHYLEHLESQKLQEKDVKGLSLGS